MDNQKDKYNLAYDSNGQLTYKGLSVQSEHGHLSASYLGKIYNTMKNAVNDHPRTFAVRVDLRLPLLRIPVKVNTDSGFSVNT